MRLNQFARMAGMDIKNYMFKEMKKIKILDALKPEHAAKVKYTAMSEPGITIERIVELASNAEMCFEREIEFRKPQRETNKKEQEPENSVKKTQQVVSTVDTRVSKKCNFCEKEGHVEADCYKENKSCFCCGKPGHMIKDCRKRIAQERNREQRGQAGNGNQREQTRSEQTGTSTRREQPRREQNTNVPRYQCPYCGEDHLMKDCEEYQNSRRRPAEN
ncbi:UNVERIFIED_CONTAM: hypothetical protein RMT77_002806 [Armadillidium vulgare]